MQNMAIKLITKKLHIVESKGKGETFAGSTTRKN